MKNIKKYIKKIIKILSLKELRILPAYLAYSFVLASIPLFTIIVIVAGRFGISIDTVINLMNDVLPGYVSSTITNVISGKNYDLSIILVSHDLDLVYKYSDRVALINGTVVCSGTPAQVFNNPATKKLFSLNYNDKSSTSGGL